jgi:hypothetical protein
LIPFRATFFFGGNTERNRKAIQLKRQRPDLPFPPTIVAFGIELKKKRPFSDCSMWGAGNWSENLRRFLLQEMLIAALHLTYITDSLIAFKGAVVDLHSALIDINSSTLKVACPAPGIGAKI